MAVTLKIGRHLLDLTDPKPELIDLHAIERSLWTARRFSNNPDSLLVRQHTALVLACAMRIGAPKEVLVWCSYHDDHEGIIGDIPGPLKHFIEQAFPGFAAMELGLDHAICDARKIARPTHDIRQQVHFFDKFAETLEWRFVMDQPEAMWNKPVHNWIAEDECRKMAEIVQRLKPPVELGL